MLSRGWLVLVLLLVFSWPVWATVSLISPVAVALQPNESASLGDIRPGQSVEIVFARDDGKGGLWNQLEWVDVSVPSGWGVSETQLFSESLVVTITVPANESEKIQSLRVRLFNSADPLNAQEVTVRLVVKTDLIKVSIVSLNSRVLLGQSASFRARLVNESVSSDLVSIRSSLPSFWFQPLVVELAEKGNPRAIQEVALVVFPKNYGVRNFSFTVHSDSTNTLLASFPEEVIVQPTLRGKFEASLFGYSFFSPSLSAYYFLNAVLSPFWES